MFLAEDRNKLRKTLTQAGLDEVRFSFDLAAIDRRAPNSVYPLLRERCGSALGASPSGLWSLGIFESSPVGEPIGRAAADLSCTSERFGACSRAHRCSFLPTSKTCLGR